MSEAKNQGESWTIQKILQWSHSYLEKQGLTESPRLDGELLLCEALKCDRMQLYMRLPEEVAPAVRANYRDLLKRRALGEPIAYILGYKEFWKHRFVVNRSVLIPRPDTERLVETSIQLIAQLHKQKVSPTDPLRVLDLGTGTGCIGLSLVLECPGIDLTGWDRSQEALDIALLNGEKLLDPKDQGRVQWVCCDALQRLEAVHRDIRHHPFDLIVSNPPYIAPSESPSLSASVLDYEPAMALFADQDGLVFYRSLAQGARSLLSPHGFLVVEIGHRQAQTVQAIFEEKGWTTRSLIKDYGKNDRCLVFAPEDCSGPVQKAPPEIAYAHLGPLYKKSAEDEVYYEEERLSEVQEKLLATYGTETTVEP